MQAAAIALYFACAFTQEQSTVVIDEEGNCLFWFYELETEKRNPCGENDMHVPENAKPINKDEYEETI